MIDHLLTFAFGAAERRPISLAHIKFSDLDLGEAPNHNKLLALVIASLAPIIDDLKSVQ